MNEPQDHRGGGHHDDHRGAHEARRVWDPESGEPDPLDPVPEALDRSAPAPDDRPLSPADCPYALADPPTETTPIAVADSLTLRSEAASAVGSDLLASGMASYRVKDAMSRTAHALGLDSFVSIVTFSDITATATLNDRYRTRVTQPEHVGVNVDHMHHTLRLVEALPRGVSATEVFDRLSRIRTRPPVHAPLVQVLAAGVACGAFAFLNQGGLVEMIGALLGASAGQAVRRLMQKRDWNHFLVTILAAIVAASVYLILVQVPTSLGWLSGSHESGYLAAVLFLVPGFPMITGILDVVRADYSAGIARLAYSVLMVTGAAAAIWAVGLVAGASNGQVPGDLGLPFGVMLPLRAVATFLGVVGFAIIFNSPWTIALAAGAVSLVANSLRYVLDVADLPIQLATFLATAVVGLLAYVVARTRHVPRTAISVPAVVIMIPGFTLYAAYALLNRGDVSGAALMAEEGIQVIVGAALGLALAHLATSPAWRRTVHPH
jgi:uncharacterized membrane protein YjjP (DUF1212 family)